MNFEQKVETYIQRHALIKENSSIVVGVSGGPDSLSLLHFLHNRREKYGFRLMAVHVDHMLRGDESKKEMEVVGEYCSNQQIPSVLKQVDVRSYMEKHQLNLQVAARECRYHIFDEVMKANQFDILALGHHGDDQIETILMRLVKGGDVKSISGIEPKRPFSIGSVVRPFLCLTKSDILHYSQKHNLQPTFDPSNEKEGYTRNRFRKVVLPFFKKENPKVHERFAAFSEQLKEDNAYLQELTQTELHKVINKKTKTEIELNSRDFLKMPQPLQRRGIQLILNYLYHGSVPSLSSLHISNVIDLMKSSHPSGTLCFPKGLKVMRSYESCVFTYDKSEKREYSIDIQLSEVVRLPNGGEIHSYIFEGTPTLQGNDNLYIRNKDIEFPLRVRSRMPGDKMLLKGMSRYKKVKDIFIDMKIPLFERDEWPLVTDKDDRIIWIPGLKKSVIEGGALEKDTYVVLQYKR
ncbi:tRNA lysidine(34) synthetase TilS [Bacillus carboniphilus]|uniref:tRNA(Ile)-lysidine synthase n=1 Tax=Bacillus carboniphilus TaxID=86663 RepID=A0ABY9JW93_9BACI|nr:tRNA lysidine(34) synthetase TilS [Bacillus carboniphilus]WLR41941.1 tRNA lysidine(34) synthetase TilS [Bacillus carboniphilus]